MAIRARVLVRLRSLVPVFELEGKEPRRGGEKMCFRPKRGTVIGCGWGRVV